MAGPALIARQILAWAMRGTKQLSPVKSTIGKVTKKGPPGFFGQATERTGTGFKVIRHPKHIKTGSEYRPWMKKVAVGEKSALGRMGIGAEGRKKFRKGYATSYAHLRKHKGKYGAGVGGAAIWDFLDDD